MKRKYRKNIWRAVGGILILSMLSGCGKKFEGTASLDSTSQEEENLIMVGVSQIGSESVWRTANTASIEETFTREKGYLMMFDNARQKQENQLKAIQSFISQQVDYIIFSPIEEDGWDMVLQEAKDAGIPVILMDRMVDVDDPSLYTAWVGSDFRKEGENAGQWLAEHLATQGRQDEEINIVMLQGTQGASSTIGRTDGFCSVADFHPNWNILEQTDAEFTTAKAKEEAKRIFTQYDDIDVFISQNDDMTFGVLEAAKEAGRSVGVEGDTIIISFDAVRDALELVQEGLINVDIECNPEQGKYLEQVIQALENGKTVEKQSYVPEKVFTQENVGLYLEDRRY